MKYKQIFEALLGELQSRILKHLNGEKTLIFINPSSSDLKSVIKQSYDINSTLTGGTIRSFVIRGLIDQSGRLIIWDGSSVLHDEVAKEYNIKWVGKVSFSRGKPSAIIEIPFELKVEDFRKKYNKSLEEIKNLFQVDSVNVYREAKFSDI